MGNLTQLLRPFESRDPLELPTVTGLFIHRVRHDRAVVPEHYLAGLPTDPDPELGPGLMGVEKRKEGIALFACGLFDPGNERRIDVQRPTTTAWVDLRDRVRRCCRRTLLCSW